MASKMLNYLIWGLVIKKIQFLFIFQKNPQIKIFMEYHANMFNTSERIGFANWLKEHKLKIKYLIKSNKYKKVKIKQNIPLKILKNMNTDYCLVLERY